MSQLVVSVENKWTGEIALSRENRRNECIFKTVEQQKRVPLSIPPGEGALVITFRDKEEAGDKIFGNVRNSCAVFSLMPYESIEFYTRDPSEKYIKRIFCKVENQGPQTYQTLQDISHIATNAALERVDMIQMLNHMQALNSMVQRMQLKTFATSNGLGPACYFFEQSNCPEFTEEYVLNLLSIACTVNGITKEEFVPYLKKPAQGGFRAMTYYVLEEMLTMTGTSCYYYGDYSATKKKGLKLNTKERKFVERMAPCFSTGINVGDCEDMAKEAHLLASCIQEMNPKNKILQELVKFLRHYTFSMASIVATSPKLMQRGDAKETEDMEDYIMHVFTVGYEKNWLKGKKTIYEPLWLEGTNFTRGFHMLNDEDAEKKWRKEAYRIRLLDEVEELENYPHVIPSTVTQQRPTTLNEQSTFYRYFTALWIKDNENLPHYVMKKDGKIGVTVQDFLEQAPGITIEPVAKRRNTPKEVQDFLSCEIPIQSFPVYVKGEIIKKGILDPWQNTENMVDVRFYSLSQLTKEWYDLLRQVKKLKWVERIQAQVFPLSKDVRVIVFGIVYGNKWDKDEMEDFYKRARKLMP